MNVTKINEAITGPFGAWVNTILLALVIFFSSKAWSVAERSIEMLYETRSDVRNLDTRIDYIERTK